jgi:hypothetical protein
MKACIWEWIWRLEMEKISIHCIQIFQLEIFLFALHRKGPMHFTISILAFFLFELSCLPNCHLNFFLGFTLPSTWTFYINGQEIFHIFHLDLELLLWSLAKETQMLDVHPLTHICLTLIYNLEYLKFSFFEEMGKTV